MPKARTTSGKKIQASGWASLSVGDDVDGDAQDHGADVLGGRGLEQVGAAAGAVADVVADEVGDDGRVARVVLGDARLDLADEVGADVGGLGVDAAAELGEERHEARRRSRSRRSRKGAMAQLDLVDEPPKSGEDAAHAEQARARRRGSPETAPPRSATWTRLDEAVPRGRGGAACWPGRAMYMPMKPEAIEQTAPTRKAMPVYDAELEAEDGGLGDLLGLHRRR